MNVTFFLNPLNLVALLTIIVISFQKSYKKTVEPTPCDLSEWLSRLTIDIPNELISNKTLGALENLTIFGLSLDHIYTSPPQKIGEKSGLNISLQNAEISVSGKSVLLPGDNFTAQVSNLSLKLPFYLIADPETGLVRDVDTKGFELDLEHVEISLEIAVAESLKKMIVSLLKGVLVMLNESVIEKQIIKTMNEQLSNLFRMVNDVIINGVSPLQLRIVTKQRDISNLRNSSLATAVSFLLNNIIGTTGPLNISHIFNVVSNGTGVLRLHEFFNDTFHFDFNVSDGEKQLANFDVGLADLNVSGLNTWDYFTLMEPFDKMTLDSHTGLKELTMNFSFSLRIAMDERSGLVREETVLVERAYLRGNLVNNTLLSKFQLPVNKNRARSFTNQECLTFDCLLDLIDSNGTGISSLYLNETFTYITLNVEDEKGGLEEDLDEMIDKLVQLFIGSYEDKIGLLMNALLNKTLINLVNSEINNFLFDKSCPGIQDPDNPEIDKKFTSIAFGSAAFLFFSIIFYPYILGKAWQKPKEEQQEKDEGNKDKKERESTTSQNIKEPENDNESANNLSLNPSPVEGFINALPPSDKEQQLKPSVSKRRTPSLLTQFFLFDPTSASLFLHPQLPLFSRLFIPLAILGTFALFLSSNSGTGASVFVVFNVGRRVQIPSLFDFGLVNSVKEMWEAGVYPMSILVALFSGIWPYLKLILMLVVFILPTTVLSSKRRGTILMVLDATGKWSILDSYVMTLMLVAFHFQIDFPAPKESTAEKGAEINVFVHAAYGFVTLIAGTLVSLCLSHAITHMHRSLEEHPDQNKGEKAERFQALISYARSKYIPDTAFRVLLSGLLISTLSLVLIGSTTTTFSFEFHGLAEYALQLFKIPSSRDYSVLSLGFSVPESYENPHSNTIRFTQDVFFLTVFLIPIAMLTSVFVLWFAPLPRKAQKTLYDVSEVLNAWSCIDVFVVAVMAAILEIRQFAKFIVGDKCNSIDPYVEKYFGTILGGYNSCFEVVAELEKGCWLLFIAAIIFFVSSFLVMRVCRDALEERLPEHVKEIKRRREEQEENLRENCMGNYKGNNSENNNKNNSEKNNKNNSGYRYNIDSNKNNLENYITNIDNSDLSEDLLDKKLIDNINNIRISKDKDLMGEVNLSE